MKGKWARVENVDEPGTPCWESIRGKFQLHVYKDALGEFEWMLFVSRTDNDLYNVELGCGPATSWHAAKRECEAQYAKYVEG